jgi:hydrogenase maturation factor
VAGGIHELCKASGTGARIHLDAIPVFQETRELAAVLDIDPLGLIGSGALLIAAPPEDARVMVEALGAESIAAVPIGTVEEEKAGVVAVERGNEKPLRRFINDELTRVL